VEFKDRRVAKLTFVRGADVASILVLPSEQFRTTNLVPNPTWLNLVPGNGVTYLILFRGNPEAMRPVEIAA
jgi:hypothetical protein